MSEDRRPLLRPRVAVPLLVLAVVAGSLIAVHARRAAGQGPFGPLQPAPPPEHVTPHGGEVVRWAYEGGMDHYQHDRFEDAAALLGRAAAGMRDDPVPTFYAGVSHLMCGHPDAAVQMLQVAVEMAPGEAMYHYYLARALHEDDQHAAAAAELDAAIGGEGRWARRAEQARARLP